MRRYTPMIIYDKLNRLERNLQRLKVRAYFMLPEKIRSAYPEEAIIKAVREARDEIWQERYAKKIARIH